jgi:hypothetical protein
MRGSHQDEAGDLFSQRDSDAQGEGSTVRMSNEDGTFELDAL